MRSLGVLSKELVLQGPPYVDEETESDKVALPFLACPIPELSSPCVVSWSHFLHWGWEMAQYTKLYPSSGPSFYIKGERDGLNSVCGGGDQQIPGATKLLASQPR